MEKHTHLTLETTEVHTPKVSDKPRHKGKNTFKDQLSRAVAVLGLIAVLLLGAWGIIQIAFNIPGVLSQVTTLFAGKPKPETIALSLPSTTTTGLAFAATWTHANKGAGNYMYSLSYSCVDGLSMKAPAPNGSLQSVACATPFNYTNATSNMQLTPTVKGKNQLTTTVTVSAIALADGAVTASHTATLTVLPERSKTAVAVAPRSSGTASRAGTDGWGTIAGASQIAENPRYSNPSGLPDLSVEITSIVPLGNGLDSVRFVIVNVGTAATPQNWTFSARLPVGYDYTYQSGAQQALYPGDKVMYSLSFSATQNNAAYNNNGNCAYQNQYSPYYNNNQYPTYYGNNYNYQITDGNYYQYHINPYQQIQNCNGYNVTQGTISSNTLTIQVDPQDLIEELTKSNNTATAAAPIGY